MEILGVAPVASSSSSSSSSGGSSSNNNGSSSLAVSHLGSGALAAAALPHIARPPGEPSLLPSSQPLGPAVPKEDLMALKKTLLGNAMASLATRHDHGWRALATGGDLSVNTFVRTDARYPTITQSICTAEINYPPHMVFQLIWNVETYPDVDFLASSARIVRVIDESTRVMHLEFEIPVPGYGTRDSLIISAAEKDDQGNFLLACLSGVDPAVPPVEDVTRTALHTCAFLAMAAPGSDGRRTVFATLSTAAQEEHGSAMAVSMVEYWKRSSGIMGARFVTSIRTIAQNAGLERVTLSTARQVIAQFKAKKEGWHGMQQPNKMECGVYEDESGRCLLFRGAFSVALPPAEVFDMLSDPHKYGLSEFPAHTGTFEASGTENLVYGVIPGVHVNDDDVDYCNYKACLGLKSSDMYFVVHRAVRHYATPIRENMHRIEFQPSGYIICPDEGHTLVNYVWGLGVDSIDAVGAQVDAFSVQLVKRFTHTMRELRAAGKELARTRTDYSVVTSSSPSSTGASTPPTPMASAASPASTANSSDGALDFNPSLPILDVDFDAAFDSGEASAFMDDDLEQRVVGLPLTTESGLPAEMPCDFTPPPPSPPSSASSPEYDPQLARAEQQRSILAAMGPPSAELPSAAPPSRPRILDLDRALLMRIFGHLSFRDLGRAAVVCRAFSEAASAPELWSRLFHINWDRSYCKLPSVSPGARELYRLERHQQNLIIGTPCVCTEVRPHAKAVRSIASDGHVLVTGGADKHVFVRSGPRFATTLENAAGSASVLDVSLYGRGMFVGLRNGQLTEYETVGSSSTRSLALTPWTLGFDVNRPRGRVICWLGDSRLHFWSLYDGSSSILTLADKPRVRCVRSWDDAIVTGTSGRGVPIWSATTGQSVCELVGHKAGTGAVVMTENVVCTASNDRTSKLWDMRSSQCIGTLYGHAKTVTCVDMLGSLIVTGSDDHNVRVWDSRSIGISLHVMQGHKAPVTAVSLANASVVSGCKDGTVRVWSFGE